MIEATPKPPENPWVHPRCAFVLHGLNSHPERMSDIAKLMESLGYKTTNGILTGHAPDKSQSDIKKISAERWKIDFQEQWNSANRDCQTQSSERIFVGFSLGALTGMNLFDSGEEKLLPSKMILLAPALALRNKTILIRAISWLPFGALPSLNHPDYRVSTSTSLSSYSALFKLHDSWQNTGWKKTSFISTMIFLAPDDELVNSQTIAQEIKKRNLNNWAVGWISNNSSKLKPNYHHLIIDERSQGSEEWKKFTTLTKTFLQSHVKNK